jgi:hypothetical protein
MGLGVGQRQGRAPRPPHDHPAVHAQVLTQDFDVGDKMIGRVGAQVDIRIAGMRCTAPTSALVEQDDTVDVGIEGPPHAGHASGSGAAVHGQRRYTVRVPAGLPIDLVAISDGEHARCVRLDGRI